MFVSDYCTPEKNYKDESEYKTNKISCLVYDLQDFSQQNSTI